MIQFPDVRIAFCDKHLKPFKAKWPKGYASLCMLMIQQILADERFIKKMNPENDEKGQLILDETKANNALLRLGKLCCFLGNETMRLVTDQALERKTGHA